ncbi:RpiB/LacA/LacB family sugar-phosphate isomerase [Candidatus Saccharibacteria bacterium]|jgi:ribose 5-phosphate isomerase B|nr:RpiB/LacA/LacB family sugar-phosphate isomerase [Candidatus Saccharibacteria bacterium]
MTQIFVGADHRGFEQKQALVSLLTNSAKDFAVVDKGAYEYNEADDFNDPAIAVAKEVQNNPGSFGILLCGSAHGVCMQANRFPGIRAINGYNSHIAQLGREHNDANVLCLSADYQNSADLAAAVQTFLTTAFLGEERYIRRNRRLDEEAR